MAYTPIPHIRQLRIAKPSKNRVISFVHKSRHAHPPAEKRALQVRLRKIAGQVRAIESMIEADADCPELLMQLVSVRRAVKSLAETIIESHLHDCIEGASRPAEARHRLRELLTVLERYVE